jgi:hypothetical protein
MSGNENDDPALARWREIIERSNRQKADTAAMPDPAPDDFEEAEADAENTATAAHAMSGNGAGADAAADGASNSSTKGDEEAVTARLAALPPLDYDRQLRPAAKLLGRSPAVLDKAVRAIRRQIEQAERAERKQAEALERECKKQARKAEEQAKKAAREKASDFEILDQPEPEKPRFANLLILVKHVKATPTWNSALRHNELTGEHEILGAWPPTNDQKNTPRPFDDPEDTYRAAMYFQGQGFAKTGEKLTFSTVAAIALEHKYHPIRNYLNGLQWDHVERVRGLFQNYFSAELPPESEQPERDRHVAYLEHISTCFMVGAVARVMQPGCKHDHVPVIVDPKQGTGKSLALRALCPDPAWFTDNLPTRLQDKDTKDALRGKWIVELSEMPHAGQAAEHLKAFLSSPTDRYRPAYGRVTRDFPRQCALIGTANRLELLDETGNRRIWPFASSGQVDVDGIEKDRDQLWAEALTLYRQGVRWWLPPNIEPIAHEKQAEFQKTDVWDDLIEEWAKKRGDNPFTMADLFAKGTGIADFRDTILTETADEMRASKCLIRLGFSKKQCTVNGKKGRWWRRWP